MQRGRAGNTCTHQEMKLKISRMKTEGKRDRNHQKKKE